MAEISIPLALCDDGFRFILLMRADKKPIEKWKENNYSYNSPALLDHIKNGNNYGICGGFDDLCVLDSDDVSRWDELGATNLIPDTLTIESRPNHRQYYLRCANQKNKPLYDPERTILNKEINKEESEHIGDIKSIDGYVVGPNCIHPTGSIYTIINDKPIATISLDALSSLVGLFRSTRNPELIKKPQSETLKNEKSGVDEFDQLPVIDIMYPSGKITKKGDEVRGDHPVHGSKNGGNYVVNTRKNAWHCKRCNRGGGSALAIAVKEGIISCAEAQEGVLRGDLFKQVLRIAEEKYGLKPRCSSNKSEELEEEVITEEELKAYSLPEGPKFVCKLPMDHFIQRYMAYGADVSDAYPDYWFAGGLHALAVVADKKIKIDLKQGTHYPNLYICILGKSTLSRKSTAVKKTKDRLIEVLPELKYSMVPTEFSAEAFVEHMDHYNHASWVRDEAAGVLSTMKKTYMGGFKDTLMQLYDCDEIHRKLRTSQRKSVQTDFNVDDPYLNILFATTDASLGANTEQNDTLSGFMARFLYFFPQGKKPRWMPLEEGTAQNSIFEEIVRNQLSDIASKVEHLLGCAAMHFSPEAKKFYDEWQRVREDEWIASNDGFCMQIHGRLAPTVAKLCMLFELGSTDFDASKTIRLEFVKEACRLVDEYFMPTARSAYDLVGANAEKNVIDRIIMYLKNHGGKVSGREILADIKIKSKDLTEYLNTMVESGTVEIKTIKRGGKGRDTHYVFLSPLLAADSKTAIS